MDNLLNTKVLLININRDKLWAVAVPIGICYIAQAAKDAGYRVKLVDLCFEKHMQKRLADIIKRYNPDIIGLSIRNIDTCEWWSRNQLLLKDVKMVIGICKSLTDAPIILGGAAVSVMPREILSYLGCNYAVVGNAERVFVEILNKIEQKKPFLDTGGVAHLIDGRYVFNHFERDDKFKGVDIADWVNFKAYKKLGAAMPIQSKRGCALNCIYCVYNKIEGHNYRLRPPAEVADDIENLIKNKGINFFEFVDSTFNIPQDHAEQICKNLILRKARAAFTAIDINPLGVSLKLLQLMKEAGFSLINIAPESASEEMLISLKKGFTLDSLKKTAEYLNKIDLMSIWRFMIGGPGETRESIRKTLEFAKEYLTGKKTIAFFEIGIRIYPGTELEQIAKRDGYISKDRNLLQPTFYISPFLKENEIIPTINREIRHHQNFALGFERQSFKFDSYFQRYRNLFYFSPSYLQCMLKFLSFPFISYIRLYRLKQIERKFSEVLGLKE